MTMTSPTPAEDMPAMPMTQPTGDGLPPDEGQMTPEQIAAHTTFTGKPGEIFDDTRTFADLGLRNSVLKGVTEAGFTKPTSIQAALIPLALTGKDIIGQAKTGTGKTAAFGLPLLHMCNRDQPFQALVLAPTRELALQITQEIEDLGKHTPIRSLCVFGGQAIHKQAKNLQKGAAIIVGTPGRVMDMVQRGHLHFKNIRFAVLDEVDRMLDIGFREDIRRILDMCPPPGPVPAEGQVRQGRQTIFVSATISPEIEKLARRYMWEPEKIVATSGSLTVSLVKQHYLTVNPWDKKRLLVHLLKHEEPALTVVFCRLKRTVDDLERLLQREGIDAHAIHGDMSQGRRNKAMEVLRSGNLAVLLASDLASRGIDVEGITHVINYDLPDDVELYVHRIGRTARAGRGGDAWSLVTPEQGPLLTAIEKLINAEIPRMDYPDFKASERPSDFRDSTPGPVVTGAPPPPKVDRLTAAANPELPIAEKAADPSKFPGGIVPTKLPPKRMFGKMPGRGR